MLIDRIKLQNENNKTMPKITFTPANITVEVEMNTPLLDAAKFAKIEIDAPCGGKGTCGKCIVKIVAKILK